MSGISETKRRLTDDPSTWVEWESDLHHTTWTKEGVTVDAHAVRKGSRSPWRLYECGSKCIGGAYVWFWGNFGPTPYKYSSLAAAQAAVGTRRSPG